MSNDDIKDHNKLCAENLYALWQRNHKRLGMTQKQVANAMGWKRPSSFSDYLHGRVAMPEHIKRRLAAILQVSVTEIDPNLSEFEGLSEDETRILKIMRSMDKSQRRVLLKAARFVGKGFRVARLD